MGFLQDGNFELTPHDSPLSKRRRFAPQEFLPMIPASDNSAIENHIFDSPLILQLCEQAPLPEDIQADLLKVGMRIRKAVPEGYKTHRFTPRPFFNMNRLSPELQAAVSGSPKQCNAELPTYGGALHKVGGLAFQPLATATFCGISLSHLAKYDTADNDQKMWTYSTSSKRGFEVEEDSDEHDWSPQTPTLMGDSVFSVPVDYFNIDMENMVEASPMTQHHKRQNSIPFQQTSLHDLNAMADRKVAKPKTRARPAAPQLPMPMTNFNPFSSLSMIQEQADPFAGLSMLPEQPMAPAVTPTASRHTRVMSCGMEASMAFNDFGDAGFLQRREDVDMDYS